MSVRPDFTIGLTSEGAFVIRETFAHEYRDAPTVRDALSEHLEGLLERLRALHGILAADLPENAERLLLDSTRLRVDELTLRPPANSNTADELLNARGGL